MTNSSQSLDAAGIDVVRAGSLYNPDLAPVPWDRRRWGLASFAALWVSMSACIPTYMLASSLIGGGMNWWEAILTVFLGNLIVLIPNQPHATSARNKAGTLAPLVPNDARHNTGNGIP
jgi:cytosine/uracil/thiamine/allantoin permease